jgi:hypothetical protein
MEHLDGGGFNRGPWIAAEEVCEDILIPLSLLIAILSPLLDSTIVKDVGRTILAPILPLLDTPPSSTEETTLHRHRLDSIAQTKRTTMGIAVDPACMDMIRDVLLAGNSLVLTRLTVGLVEPTRRHFGSSV